MQKFKNKKTQNEVIDVIGIILVSLMLTSVYIVDFDNALVYWLLLGKPVKTD